MALPTNILLIHADDAWRRRAAAVVTGAGWRCREAADLPMDPVRDGVDAVDAVVVQACHARPSSADAQLNELRRILPLRPIIAIVREDRADVTRRAFRAGACDCVLETSPMSALVHALRDAVSPGFPAGANHAVRRPGESTVPACGLRVLHAQGVSCRLQRGRHDMCRTCTESTVALVAAVEAKDAHTRAHSTKVAAIATEIGLRLGFSDMMLRVLESAALLHDVGKIGVPDSILTKTGALTEDEFQIVKKHPRTALDILDGLTLLGDERSLILHHHERFDGRGYPSGLRGDEIPIGARVLAVADAIDAMTSPRVYKPAYPLDHVRAELRSQAGRQFDPRVAGTALRWLERVPPAYLAETRATAVCRPGR